MKPLPINAMIPKTAKRMDGKHGAPVQIPVQSLVKCLRHGRKTSGYREN